LGIHNGLTILHFESIEDIEHGVGLKAFAFPFTPRMTFREKGVVEELREPLAWSSLDWASGRDRLRGVFPRRTSTSWGVRTMEKLYSVRDIERLFGFKAGRIR